MSPRFDGQRRPPGRVRPPQAVVVGAILLLAAVQGAALLVFASNHIGRPDPVAGSPVPRTTAPTSSTTTDTTLPPPILVPTTAGPVPTVPEIQCASSSGDPTTVVAVVFAAFNLGDRGCAGHVATPAAVDKLFAVPGSGFAWVFQSCVNQAASLAAVECSYRFDGGEARFALSQTRSGDWQVTDVALVAT